MVTSALERELKRGSTEVLILSLLEHRQRHGYEIGQLIAERSQGAISFHIASLYPTLYRLESKGLHRRAMGGKGGPTAAPLLSHLHRGPETSRLAAAHLADFLEALNRVAGIATP